MRVGKVDYYSQPGTAIWEFHEISIQQFQAAAIFRRRKEDI
jgi:hypothetical protein